MVECVSWLTRNGVTPGISPFCRVPARLIWNISPLSATHSICPGIFHQSSLLQFTFHHRQTLAWLCPNSTMSSAATSINTLTLPLSSRGTLTKPTSRRSCQTFTNMYPCPTRGPNTLDHCYTQFKNAYKARSLPAFGKSDHAAIFLTPEYKQRVVQEALVEREATRWFPLWSYATGGSRWRRLGHAPG